ALLYALLWRVLRGSSKGTLSTLGAGFGALALIFATLTVPLAVDARWTSAAWAIEAAGVYWIGCREDRRLARGFALLLQFAAGIAWLARGRALASAPVVRMGLRVVAGRWPGRNRRSRGEPNRNPRDVGLGRRQHRSRRAVGATSALVAARRHGGRPAAGAGTLTRPRPRPWPDQRDAIRMGDLPLGMGAAFRPAPTERSARQAHRRYRRQRPAGRSGTLARGRARLRRGAPARPD